MSFPASPFWPLPSSGASEEGEETPAKKEKEKLLPGSAGTHEQPWVTISPMGTGT